MGNAGFLEKVLVNNFVWGIFQRRVVVPVWRESIQPQNDMAALEIGCGRGMGAAIFLDNFSPSRIDAFDIDETMVRKARRYLGGEYDEKIRVFVGDVTNISSQDDAYDVVFDFFTLHYVDDWQRGISEISRVLKPGGIFAFSELYGQSIGNHMLRQFMYNPPRGGFDRGALVKSFAENRLRLMEGKKELWGYGIAGAARKI
jgi:ubiquinone/menaquinone biosynthesis C-methylase UbiE